MDYPEPGSILLVSSGLSSGGSRAHRSRWDRTTAGLSPSGSLGRFPWRARDSSAARLAAPPTPTPAAGALEASLSSARWTRPARSARTGSGTGPQEAGAGARGVGSRSGASHPADQKNLDGDRVRGWLDKILPERPSAPSPRELPAELDLEIHRRWLHIHKRSSVPVGMTRRRRRRRRRDDQLERFVARHQRRGR